VNYSRSAKQAESLVTEIRDAGGDAFAVAADISDLDQVDAMFATIRAHLPTLDILVNNAGRGSGGMPTLETSSQDDYDMMFGLNTRGLFFVTQAAVKMMADGGRVVNLSSNSTRARQPGLAIYAGSKAAVEAFTRIWAAELASRRITVNNVLPGIVDTDLIRDNLPPEVAQEAGRRVPLGRLGQPADIADVVAFLCSDDARWITGQDIVVTGGS
jgi:3-oxoacyl-[acyl-carrier protein] reductase